MNFIQNVGHIVIGGLAIAALTVLAISHDITGASAAYGILGTAGVAIGANVIQSGKSGN